MTDTPEEQKKIHLVAKGLRLCSYLIHVRYPDSDRYRVILNEYDIFNEAYRTFMLTGKSDEGILQVESFVVMSMYVSTKEIGPKTDLKLKDSAQDTVYYGLLNSIEHGMEFFYFVYTLLKPEDSKKYVQPYITYDSKLAAMRVFKNLIAKNGYQI